MEPLKNFTYFGRDRSGGYASGEIRAADAAAARQELDSRSIACDFLAAKEPPFWRRHFRFRRKPCGTATQLVSFTHQLALLLRAGIHLVDGL
ncbi:MAG: hypothetical protein LBH53_02610, partial [Puniceicoccales bacterium]|nr:hypothetical protein [Puniceicoccales bacterium]